MARYGRLLTDSQWAKLLAPETPSAPAPYIPASVNTILVKHHSLRYKKSENGSRHSDLRRKENPFW